MKSCDMNEYLASKLTRIANLLVSEHECNRAVISHDMHDMYIELIVQRQFEMCIVSMSWGTRAKHEYYRPSVTLSMINLEDAQSQHGKLTPFTPEMLMHHHGIAIDVFNGNYPVESYHNWDEQTEFEYTNGFEVQILSSCCSHCD